MKIGVQLAMVLTLGASGVLVFACGGGNSESGPTNAGSASATQAPSAPASTASAATTATVSATAAASSATPMPPATPLTVIAMKATMTAGGKSHTLELKADGTLLADGKAAGKVTGAEVDDDKGQPMIAVNGDNTLRMPGSTTSSAPKFNDKDAIEVNGATVMSVADDGTVTVIGADGKPDTKMKMKFTGFKPTARRTATLIVFGMLLAKPMTPTTTPVTPSAVPATTSAPTTKKP